VATILFAVASDREHILFAVEAGRKNALSPYRLFFSSCIFFPLRLRGSVFRREHILFAVEAGRKAPYRLIG
jgi:hypothetical protein